MRTYNKRKRIVAYRFVRASQPICFIENYARHAKVPARQTVNRERAFIENNHST